MPNLSPEKLLATAIDRLRSERAALMSRVSEIDASFGRLGISPAGSAAVTPATAGKRIGRPPGTKNSPKKSPIATKPAKPAKSATVAGKPGRKKGKRGSFAISGEESILAFVASAGQPNAAEINIHWKNEGRGGVANTPISKLVKAGKLKSVAVVGERGSRYTIA